jgi:hypothetical protein
MSLKTIGAIAVAAAVTLAIGAADAATTKRKPTRVVVTKRSYLDAGTTPNPGERNYYNQVVYPPGYNPFSFYNIDPMHSYRYPLPDPFWLPGSTGY